MRWLAALLAGLAAAAASTQSLAREEVDSEESRKVLGSSVVTSVSVIMDHGNGTKTYIGESNDGSVGSPGDLLSPDRYEFYTFDESGDLVKRLMTLDQIQGLIAGGDSDGMESDASAPTYYHEVLPDVEPSDLQGVHKVVANVQNVLKSELEASKNKLPMTKPLAVLSVPDAASSWSILLPGVIGGPLEDNRAPESASSSSSPSPTTPPSSSPLNQQPTSTNSYEEITQKETTENPTIIHYLPIQNIPAPPKKNSSSNNLSSSKISSTTKTTFVSSTSTTTKQPSTVPETIGTKSGIPESTIESFTSQSILPSSTSATSSETVPVMEEMAASLSSVLSQVVEDKTNITNALESNYIPIGFSSQNYGTPAAESRPQTTKIQYSSTTPLTFTTLFQQLQSDNKLSAEKPNEKLKDKLTAQTKPNKGSTNNTPKIPQQSASSTTEKINLTSLEYNNGAVSDYQMISEALAAQANMDNSWKIEPNKQLTDITESTQYITDLTTETFPTETEITERNTNVQITTQGTTKPVSSIKAKPTTKPVSTVENTSKTATSTAGKLNVNTTKNNINIGATIKPTTINSQSRPNTYKVPTLSKIQAASNVITVTTNPSPTTSRPVSSTQIYKKVSPTTTTTATVTSAKPKPAANKKPITKPTVKPTVAPTTSTYKIKQNVTNSQPNKFDKDKTTLTTQKEKQPISITTELSPPAEFREETTKFGLAGQSAEKLIQTTTTYFTLPTEDKSDSITLHYDNNNSKNQANYIASSSNKETVSVNPTTENVSDMTTTNTDLVSEGELLQEGISAVTSILLHDNNKIQPVPANRFTGMNSRQPVMGELKHASQINSDEVESTTTSESKEIYFTTLDTTDATDIVTTTTSDEATNESLTTDKDLTKSKTEVNSNEDETTTEYQTTTETEMIGNTESSLKTVNDNVTSTLNISAIEFTTSIYEGTTDFVQQERVNESAEKKTADYELENGQSTQLKESKLSPESLSTKGTGATSNLINNDSNKTISNSNKIETNKIQSLNFVGNSTKSHFNITTNDIKTEGLSLRNNVTYNTEESINNRPALKRPGEQTTSSSPVELHPAPHESLGLEASTSLLGDDVRRFADLCNELAFRMWTSITGKGSISARSLVLSPFAVTSLLAMVFLGARGPTSGQMNDVLRLDDMVTFNPHQVLQNVTESVLNSKNYGVATAAFVRQLYSDKVKGKILDFYKERAQQYYDGHVEEINFASIGDVLRRRTNLLIKRQTLGRVPEYLRGSSLSLRPPLAAFSANIFQTDCEQASIEGRDGEMYFVVRPSTRQRRLVPVPAAVWRTGFLAGYEPGLDATAVCLGADSIVSTLFILPGQQGQIAPGDGLARLEQRLIETSYRRGGWSRLLRSLLVRPGLELQVPRFSHRSVLNVTGSLQRMGLKDLFNAGRADLRGLNGLSNDLHLSDMVQINTFSTCAEDTVGARHHTETYPVSPQRMGREETEPLYNPLEAHDFSHIPLALRPRQARLPDNPRLRFDRPFLYMVRHNPTGMILHMGRFNPRLLP